MTDERSSTEEQVYEILGEALEKVRVKNGPYGDAWREQGWRGNLGRILSKNSRLRNLLWRSGTLCGVSLDETVEDTALDQIALLAFFVINYRKGNEWGDPSA